MHFTELQLNSLNYLHHLIVILFYSRVWDLYRDQSLIVSKPEGELISVLPQYSKL